MAPGLAVDRSAAPTARVGAFESPRVKRNSLAGRDYCARHHGLRPPPVAIRPFAYCRAAGRRTILHQPPCSLSPRLERKGASEALQLCGRHVVAPPASIRRSKSTAAIDPRGESAVGNREHCRRRRHGPHCLPLDRVNPGENRRPGSSVTVSAHRAGARRGRAARRHRAADSAARRAHGIARDPFRQRMGEGRGGRTGAA